MFYNSHSSLMTTQSMALYPYPFRFQKGSKGCTLPYVSAALERMVYSPFSRKSFVYVQDTHPYAFMSEYLRDASSHVVPLSRLISTLLIFPAPVQAIPVTCCSPVSRVSLSTGFCIVELTFRVVTGKEPSSFSLLV